MHSTGNHLEHFSNHNSLATVQNTLALWRGAAHMFFWKCERIAYCLSMGNWFITVVKLHCIVYFLSLLLCSPCPAFELRAPGRPLEPPVMSAGPFKNRVLKYCSVILESHLMHQTDRLFIHLSPPAMMYEQICFCLWAFNISLKDFWEDRK